MTQAFNLSQLANNLNTAGQLDATDGLTGAVPVANGGTGQSSLTANAVLIGNGTSGITSVAPSTSGNILTSNGTSWVSQAPSGGGVTSFNSNTGAIEGMQRVATGTFSNASTINITNLPSGYAFFKILMYCMTGSGGSSGQFVLRISNNNGSSYFSSNTYNGCGIVAADGSSNYQFFDSTQANLTNPLINGGDIWSMELTLVQKLATAGGSDRFYMFWESVYQGGMARIAGAASAGVTNSAYYCNAVTIYRTQSSVVLTGGYTVYGVRA